MTLTIETYLDDIWRFFSAARVSARVHAAWHFMMRKMTQPFAHKFHATVSLCAYGVLKLMLTVRHLASSSDQTGVGCASSFKFILVWLRRSDPSHKVGWKKLEVREVVQLVPYFLAPVTCRSTGPQHRPAEPAYSMGSTCPRQVSRSGFCWFAKDARPLPPLRKRKRGPEQVAFDIAIFPRGRSSTCTILGLLEAVLISEPTLITQAGDAFTQGGGVCVSWLAYYPTTQVSQTILAILWQCIMCFDIAKEQARRLRKGWLALQ